MIIQAYFVHAKGFFPETKFSIKKTDDPVKSFKNFLKSGHGHGRCLTIDFCGDANYNQRKIILPELFIHQLTYALESDFAIQIFDADEREGCVVDGRDFLPDALSCEVKSLFESMGFDCGPNPVETEKKSVSDLISEVTEYLILRKKPFRVIGFAFQMMHVHISKKFSVCSCEDVIEPSWLEDHLL